MTLGRAELKAMARSVPSWFHSMDLGHGVATPGVGSHQGKDVLDINALDRFSPLRPKAKEALGGLSHWITTCGRWIWLPIVSIESNARAVGGLG
jgi:hypothetical protein